MPSVLNQTLGGMAPQMPQDPGLPESFLTRTMQMLQEQQAQQERRQQEKQMMIEANQQGHQLDNLAAIAKLANNPSASDSASYAAKSRQDKYKPDQLGVTGYSLPASGEFVENPMHADDRDASRELARSNAELANSTKMVLGQLGHQDRQEANRIRGLKVGQGKPPRTLAGSDVKELQKYGSQVTQLNDLKAGWKPELAGTGPVLAQVQNLLGQYQPLGVGRSYGEQANWWQNYNQWKNIVRHDLFGSALTSPERASFDAANIKEGMDPGMIKTRLRQQQQSAVRAYNKLKNSYGAAKYDVEGFPDMELPFDPDDPSQPLPGQVQGNGGTQTDTGASPQRSRSRFDVREK